MLCIEDGRQMLSRPAGKCTDYRYICWGWFSHSLWLKVTKFTNANQSAIMPGVGLQHCLVGNSRSDTLYHGHLKRDYQLLRSSQSVVPEETTVRP